MNRGPKQVFVFKNHKRWVYIKHHRNSVLILKKVLCGTKTHQDKIKAKIWMRRLQYPNDVIIQSLSSGNRPRLRWSAAASDTDTLRNTDGDRSGPLSIRDGTIAARTVVRTGAIIAARTVVRTRARVLSVVGSMAKILSVARVARETTNRFRGWRALVILGAARTRASASTSNSFCTSFSYTWKRKDKLCNITKVPTLITY